jgi:murein DD-endopeptidase MepM/ murein hydrolase activator NlpD
MPTLAWPLQRNTIRRQLPNNTFGAVRNGGTRNHAGWDLYALPLTTCYAVADGVIADARYSQSYGNLILLAFKHRDRTLYAAYCHLSFFFVRKGDAVARSQPIGTTGNTGNASNMMGEDQHLHFEIRTTPWPPSGLGGRIDPAQLYGRAPINTTIVQGHGAKPPTSGVTGLRARDYNVLP